MRNTATAAVLALLCALLISACSSSPTGPEPGGGGQVEYVEVTEGHLTFQVPSTWQKSTGAGKPFEVKYSGNGMQLQAAGELGDDSGAYAALARLDLPAMVGLTGYQPGATDRITVDGAHDAVLRNFTYTDGSSTKHGIWIVATQWPYPKSAALAITGTQVDPDVAAHIQETLQFKTYH
ncbi:hypothetical protein ATK17_2584 [Branchiibius hedensis]|uniref:Lipoprotein n=1 Tax=Branchiibius hedensis TaxID=672460 RepID=A0A2Y8ZTB6_9MICO|nr:hypothetical protein [Branchiibius hedensis]PWJ26422.1 hypothetical protein ATK17_2584 [Branchiibius hedensis]SSA35234.1 hypothetical protein SAMN04489750_2584 [Branchiibius hedensis]